MARLQAQQPCAVPKPFQRAFLVRTLNLSPFYRCIVALCFPGAQVLFLLFRGMILPISGVVTVFCPATFPPAISADGVIQSDFAAKRLTSRPPPRPHFTHPNRKSVFQ